MELDRAFEPELDPAVEAYKPFQRLDFAYDRKENSLLVRALLYVRLYDGESIETPDIVEASGFTHSETLLVMGKSTGNLRLQKLEYFIDFSLMKDQDNILAKDDESWIRAAREIITKKLVSSTFMAFVVNTKITKNPTEEVTNTISQDGDIEPRR